MGKKIKEQYFSYKYENDIQGLINRLSNYSMRSRKDGVLSLENDVNEDKNTFLKRVLSNVIDGCSTEVIKEDSEILIKYYIQDIKKKKKKNKIEKQMQMILLAGMKIQNGSAPRTVESILLCFYPYLNVKSQY